ncbi:MAG TPA: amidohydrolase family protein [Ilumatobacteraceae bacterium]|nr:amidohydrolase family protein [Ilumatobacteraceae bacterium]
MAALGFRPFDADNHYYEATDAFIRHIPKDMERRCMQWVELGGKQRLLVGGKVNNFIPNPTFDPVSKPGALNGYFRGKVAGADLRTMFGELDPIPAAYRDRDARLVLMDQQGLDGAFFFPTLGVGMEESLRHDVPALCAAFRAFNRWLDDDWGFAYRDRIFGAPYITLADPEWAIQELQWAIGRGVRVIVMRTAPVPTSTGGTRSPGDPVYDPFWAAAADAGVVVAFHSGDSGYGKYIDDWEPTGDFKAFQFSPMRGLTSDRAPYDMFAVLVCHGVFSRHGGLRVAAIESGSEWVAPLMKKLAKAYAQNPHAFGADPVQQLRDHLWVAPFYEDDIRGLADCVGVEHVLFGSDYPHAEGLADPLDFVDDLDGFSDAEVRQVMSSNAISLLNG